MHRTPRPAKVANLERKRAKELARERRQRGGWYWLGFANNSRFLGGAIVWAHGFETATLQARKLNITRAFRGQLETFCESISARDMERVPASLRNRLLSENEVLEQLDGQHLFDDAIGRTGLKHMIGPDMRRVQARKEKQLKPAREAREEILKGIGWEPLDFPPDVPADVVEAENRRMQDEIVGWVQGLAAHIDKYDQAQKAARRPMRYPAASVQVEIDPASEVGAMMAELRRRIDPVDLAGNGIAAPPDITVRSGISNSYLDGLRHYLRSLNPFEITFGKVSFFPASVNSDNAAVLKVDVISPALEEINLAMEQHANCTPADSDYQPHAIVANLKPKAVKKYIGNDLLAGQTMEVSTLSIWPQDGEPEFVPLIDAPAPWKEDDYNWPGDEVKPPQRKRAKSSPSRTGVKPPQGKRAKSSPSRTGAKKRPRGGH
jgi:hypothetical protein